jgi:hypothetical protein
MGMIQIPFGHASVSRIEPEGLPQQYKTYSALFPVQTHYRRATCEEIDCLAYLNGWSTTVDISTQLGQKQYDFVTHDRERTFMTEKSGLSLVKFTFAPGQPCFDRANHKVQLERPGRFVVRQGDFRQYGKARVHVRPEDWVEDFAEHQSKIQKIHERG